MQRTTIMLPPALKLEAQRLAQERGVSLGDLIRQALSSLLGDARGESADSDPLFGDNAIWGGETPEDLALDPDRYLYGTEKEP